MRVDRAKDVNVLVTLRDHDISGASGARIRKKLETLGMDVHHMSNMSGIVSGSIDAERVGKIKDLDSVESVEFAERMSAYGH